MDDDIIDFIYGDDWGDIEIEELGEYNGTVTRRMDIPRKLARDLYEDLGEKLDEREDKYLVVFSANTGFAELANVNVVEATSEDEARQKVDDLDNSQNFGSCIIKKLDELETPYQYFR